MIRFQVFFTGMHAHSIVIASSCSARMRVVVVIVGVVVVVVVVDPCAVFYLLDIGSFGCTPILLVLSTLLT